MFGALTETVGGSPRRLQDLASPADELPSHKERDQRISERAEFALPGDQVVLVAAVGVAGRIGVVLEQVDVAFDALLGQPQLRFGHQAFQHPFPGLVVGDRGDQIVTFRGGVFGMAADVEVEPGAVAQEHIRTATPRHHPPKQVSRDLVGRQSALPIEHAGDPVFGFDAVDAPLHELTRQ